MKEKNKEAQTSVHANENEYAHVYYPDVLDQETLLFLEVLWLFLLVVLLSLPLLAMHV